ncbi:phosphotransferase [Streptomyces sp. NPDC059398]|uniref:phosphotransferase n=1 Tax=Streptomyces sp. NPDC059398 TaxID=3346820 RepID=UPI0036BE615D
MHDWVDGDWAFEAEVLDYIAQPVVSADRADIDHAPGLSDAWWEELGQALRLLAKAEGVRTTVRDEWMERAFPQFLGVPPPARVQRVTGHGDLHWGNLTTAPLCLLDWERWGSVPYGYDVGLLHANSLLVPEAAARIRGEFAHILDSPGGRIGELAALAEMLQAVARGWYPELAPRLMARAHAITGVRPPAPAHAEVPEAK